MGGRRVSPLPSLSITSPPSAAAPLGKALCQAWGHWAGTWHCLQAHLTTYKDPRTTPTYPKDRAGSWRESWFGDLSVASARTSRQTQAFPLTPNHRQLHAVSCVHVPFPWRAVAARAACSLGYTVPATPRWAVHSAPVRGLPVHHLCPSTASQLRAPDGWAARVVPAGGDAGAELGQGALPGPLRLPRACSGGWRAPAAVSHLLPAPALRPAVRKGSIQRSDDPPSRAACRTISDSPEETSPKPTESGTNSQRSRWRVFPPPCTRRSLRQAQPGIGGEQKPFNAQNQVTFLPRCVTALGRFGPRHAVVKKSSHPALGGQEGRKTLPATAAWRVPPRAGPSPRFRLPRLLRLLQQPPRSPASFYQEGALWSAVCTGSKRHQN